VLTASPFSRPVGFWKVVAPAVRADENLFAHDWAIIRTAAAKARNIRVSLFNFVMRAANWVLTVLFSAGNRGDMSSEIIF